MYILQTTASNTFQNHNFDLKYLILLDSHLISRGWNLVVEQNLVSWQRKTIWGPYLGYLLCRRGCWRWRWPQSWWCKRGQKIRGFMFISNNIRILALLQKFIHCRKRSFETSMDGLTRICGNAVSYTIYDFINFVFIRLVMEAVIYLSLGLNNCIIWHGR